MQNKKIWWVVALVVVIVLVSIKNFSSKTPMDNTFTIGAVLPLTGAAGLWGETIKNGMDLALAEKPNMKVIYEDSKGTAVDGLSAFNSLQTKGVDLSISAFSAVSVALSKVALDRKIPLVATMATADGIANPYTIRYYNNATIYAEPAFVSTSSPVQTSKKIGLLYRSDDLGVSLLKEVKALSAKYGKDLVFAESFKQNETDYLTVLSKAKASGAEVLLFSDATPVEGVGILKKAIQLNIKIPLVEVSAVFADLGNRKLVAGIPFYSTAFDFSLPDRAVDFKAKYLAKYGKDANYAAAFAYDLINFIDGCSSQKKDILSCLGKVKQVSGFSGTANQVAPNDFVVTMHLEKVN